MASIRGALCSTHTNPLFFSPDCLGLSRCPSAAAVFLIAVATCEELVADRRGKNSTCLRPAR